MPDDTIVIASRAYQRGEIVCAPSGVILGVALHDAPAGACLDVRVRGEVEIRHDGYTEVVEARGTPAPIDRPHWEPFYRPPVPTADRQPAVPTPAIRAPEIVRLRRRVIVGDDG